MKLQFLRYATAGGTAFAVDVGVFATLRIAGLDLVTANLLGRTAGAGIAFLMNRTWTFFRPAAARSAWAWEACRYAALWLLASALSSLGIAVATRALSVPAGPVENLIKVMVDTMILGMNFIVSRHWVFRATAVAREDVAPMDRK